jgi:hypothetical protein
VLELTKSIAYQITAKVRRQGSTAMAQVTLDSALSHTVLECVSNFWFRHLEDDHVIVPSIEDATPWFSQNDQFDQECL